jgi:hypothetical protein
MTAGVQLKKKILAVILKGLGAKFGNPEEGECPPLEAATKQLQ